MYVKKIKYFDIIQSSRQAKQIKNALLWSKAFFIIQLYYALAYFLNDYRYF